MKGLWKTSVSGYRKDSKRKRTTRKHVIKDSIKWKYFHTDLDDVEYIPEVIIKNGTHKDIYNVDLSLDYLTYKQYHVYISSGWSYTHYVNICTNEVIQSVESRNLKFLYKKYIHFNEPDATTHSVRCHDWKKDIKFIAYGEVVQYHEIPIGYGKRRKIASKFAHRKDRALLRSYISTSDWSKDVPTHSTSKSIKWEIS